MSVRVCAYVCACAFRWAGKRSTQRGACVVCSLMWCANATTCLSRSKHLHTHTHTHIHRHVGWVSSESRSMETFVSGCVCSNTPM